MAHPQRSRRKLYQVLGSILGMIVLLVWIEGGFTAKTPAGVTEIAGKTEPNPGPSARAEFTEIDDMRSWPATVSAHTVAQIASKVPARVLEITVRPGDNAKAGQVLVRLDERELKARLSQARSVLAAAEAQWAKASADARRTQTLFDAEAATRQQLDTALAASRSGAAQIAEARAAVGAAASVVSEGVLRAPFDGAVVKRLMEPGDLALPGQPVITMQSMQRLRIEAAIPESCARSLQQGQELTARIDEKTYLARIEEIAPAADAQTRTVLIKTALDPRTHPQPGTFAWLEQACGRHRALLIPANAVSHTGQLESVHVLIGRISRLRHVRTGKTRGGWVEVLSGLKEGETVLTGAKQ